MVISLAELTKEARQRQDNMSQGDLARLVGCSSENITAIENGRNRQPSPEIIDGLARALELPVEDIYSAIAGRLHRLPWEKVGELDLRDPELELMFRQLDALPNEEARERVKDFIRFVFDQERKRQRMERDKAR